MEKRRAAGPWWLAWTLVLAVAGSAAPARAVLLWRGQDLGAQGIHKGAGLPLFAVYMDGIHSSFGTQESSKDTPAWTLFAGTYNQYYYADSLRDDRGHDVPGRFHLNTFLLFERLILLTPLRTERVQHFVEAVPTLVATDFAVGSAAASTAGPSDLAFGTGFLFPDVYESEALKVEALTDIDVFLPTGHYQRGGLRNLSFDTYSYLFSNDLILHFRGIGNGLFFEPSLYFAGSTENDDFRNPLTGERSRYQLGQAVQVLFKLIANLDRARTRSLGIEGFFDIQYLDDRMDGSRIHNSAERGQMLGPIGTAVIGGFLVDASVLREFAAVNRPQGTRFTLIVYRVF
jgi:hypothetical protein